jgi:hypothetical protein
MAAIDNPKFQPSCPIGRTFSRGVHGEEVIIHRVLYLCHIVQSHGWAEVMINDKNFTRARRAAPTRTIGINFDTNENECPIRTHAEQLFHHWRPVRNTEWQRRPHSPAHQNPEESLTELLASLWGDWKALEAKMQLRTEGYRCMSCSLAQMDRSNFEGDNGKSYLWNSGRIP